MGIITIIMGFMAKKNITIYTVSQITSLIKGALAGSLPSRVSVCGEISNWKHHSSGHCYFDLKDEGSVVPAVMWSSKFKGVKFAPENGMAVVCRGYIDVYEPQGKYQFYAEKIEPAGAGALQIAFEQMKKRLEEEGLFAAEHKKVLPRYPMRIGIVTSESGAAYHDIADSINKRWSCCELYLFGVLVQGESAGKDIAAKINYANSMNEKLKLDILIVGRGGGSMEDLWAFNEEVVARAIFASKIPVISAVGHEVDYTIADLVADVRASTPTQAGVLAVPDANEVLGEISGLSSRLYNNLNMSLKSFRHEIEIIATHRLFQNPESMVSNRGQYVDEMVGRLRTGIKERLRRANDEVSGYYERVRTIEPGRLIGAKRLELAELASKLKAGIKERMRRANSEVSECYERVRTIEPGRLIGAKRLELVELSNRSRRGISNVMNKKMMAITAVENRLSGMDPRSVLKRGYSITTIKSSGKIVKSTNELNAGDEIVTEFAESQRVESQVTKKVN